MHRKVGDRRFKPHSGLQVSKTKCFYPLTRNDSIVWHICAQVGDIQTDILLIKKIIFVIKMIAYMYMYIYKMVNLLKLHDHLLGTTYRIKIMLNGIAIKKHPKTLFILFFSSYTL